MAWAIEQTSSSGGLYSSPIPIASATTVRIEIENATIDTGNTGYIFAMEDGGSHSFSLFSTGYMGLFVGGSITNLGTPLAWSNEKFSLEVNLSSGTLLLLRDSEVLLSRAYTKGANLTDRTLRLFRRSGGAALKIGSILGDTSVFVDGVLVRKLSMTASDQSNGGGSAPYPQPIVVDTVSSNNATGVNFPTTDLGYWVDLGGGATTPTNNIYINGNLITDVKFYNGVAYIPVEVYSGNTLVWKE